MGFLKFQFLLSHKRAILPLPKSKLHVTEAKYLITSKNLEKTPFRNTDI